MRVVRFTIVLILLPMVAVVKLFDDVLEGIIYLWEIT